MRIGILGAGDMADALGTQWVRAGHEVMVSGRSPERATALADRMGPAARAGTFAEAAAFGSATLLAVPASAALAVLSEAGAEEGLLGGRVLVDCTNPVVPGRFTLERRNGASLAEEIAGTTGAHVVKAFNVCHVDVWRMRPPVFDGRPLAVPLCGDDDAALTTVRDLVSDLGCTPIDGGGLERAGLLEATAAFVIGLWVASGADAQAILPPVRFAVGAD
ncbi:hypothetical protein LX15_002156 [Streptoalloteichus tenebrarius]|uniref:Pyrroline-5-carboxylate reductase catalytic N-terminal domain-containing protein n=1 Tax=Streptoalloteichus tenebrarius (strain ATCC 17920 / DSM 40477 / JCM 4838 / CBS 697.72 / NBRC 16177 / NCIMB 11028 / NRRL B-12390 / A12253. 1 / ISP 5477) TaxID=1933 RepID=A0ABT1HSI2_STRSD|nr:hypothetical protein [Streptoalloteichus tenebrarius]BFF03634.1 NAD(P)-binding domain-containing protein [Streptoalloteichus tenebrarius]